MASECTYMYIHILFKLIHVSLLSLILFPFSFPPSFPLTPSLSLLSFLLWAPPFSLSLSLM